MQDRNWSDMIDLAARLGGGHVTMQHPDYRDTPSLKKTVRQTDGVLNAATSAPSVEKVTARITGPIMLNTSAESFGTSAETDNKTEINKEPEMFEVSSLEEDFEIPAFLRKQKN